jgi:threonine dehydrogenase-like Zn-dependent dehydrogenase
VLIRELHVFRGIEKCEPGFIMGHEFTGTVKEIGSKVKGVKIGDRVVSPFTVSWYLLCSSKVISQRY